MLKRVEVDYCIRGKIADLLIEPQIVRVNKFDEEGHEKFCDGMTKAYESGQSVIPVVIDSYGGSVYSLLGMISMMQSMPVPVATIVDSKASSAGAVLFAMGTEGYRFMSPLATMLIHEVSSFTCGKVEELKADVANTNRLNKLVFEIMAEHTGHEPNYFLELVEQHKHADWYLTAKEAKRYNLANHLRIPELCTKISVITTLK